MGLSFPRKILAIWTARRPRIAPSASTTCHLRWSKLFLGKNVFINSHTGSGEPIKRTPEVNRQKNHNPDEVSLAGQRNSLCEVPTSERQAKKLGAKKF